MSSLAELFVQALRHHQSGQLSLAENLYRQVLQADPHHVNAWHLLGILAGQVGRHELAVQYMGQALRLKPDYAEAHLNLGKVLREQGNVKEAESCFREALRHRRDIAEAYSQLGMLLADQGKREEAAVCYRQALRLKPSLPEVHYNLGILLGDQGKLEEAEACYRQALRLKAAFAEAHFHLGNLLSRQDKLKEAEVCYRQTLRLKPGLAEVHFKLGNVLAHQGKLKEGEASFREALRHQPDFAEAYKNLGNVLRDQGKPTDAEACCREALRLKPGYAEAYNILGGVLGDQGNGTEAELCYREALRHKPDFGEAQSNLGLVLRDQGKLDEAAACFREVLRHKPDFAEVHKNLSHVLLLQGQLAEGWPEYEWRWQIKDNLRCDVPPPTWDGSNLAGRTILLQAEQGFGDTLQFVRYAPLVKKRDGRVLLQCQPALASLLASCPGVDQVVPKGAPLPRYHVSAPLMSLPKLFGTTLESIPSIVPYLKADQRLTEHWKKELHQFQELKIGIVWQGDPRPDQPNFRSTDRRRSIPLCYFEPLARLSGVRLFSLQKGHGQEQLLQGGPRLGIVNLADRLHDFGDTAAVMMNLDLIISGCTSPAHLAGALGRPVWTVLAYSACWRWLLDREDSPWYPTMRLFRQQRACAWGEVFERITIALRQLVEVRE